ncbi:MAG: choice-of-anchor J domain-containing protein [Candidatus Phocaeicola excrementipullorum]|uniref:Choice-of-anchor J domain-containing protein n=1 Tax=Candidatus Phocaeicola excrementipullorum TaxID=2838731 RepID=A0A948X1I8_9BACT|nr:choice-of-anchor J domain-containing protein [Candidatus Phocaeicola excrementipullorum]
MKLLNKFSLLLLSASFAFTACERDYDAPPLSEPEYTGPAANTTIAELRELGASATQDVPFVIAGDFVLKATVTGNDESGNIYKKIYFQDETSAIEMEVDQNSVYNYYPVGQVVYVNLKGLSISVYGDEQQLGHPDGYLYRTPWETFQEVVSKDGWANPENAKPTVIDDISTVNTNVDGYKFKLVQFTNVSFANGGKNIFAPESGYGEENIVDSHGNTLMVRTSNYADFAGQTLPAGRGNVTGILGRFNGTWQLTLRSINDVADFTGESTGDGEQGGETETILDEPFDQAGGIGSFTIEDILLPQGSTYVWSAANYNEKYYMQASAFVNGANQNSESRLVSPALDLTNRQNIILTFDHVFRNFGTDTHLNDLKLEVREQGGNSWEEVAIPNYSTGEDNVFIPSGEIDLSNYGGKTIQFAFHYKSSTENALRWQIQNVKVTATSGGGSQGGNTGDGGTPIEPIPTNN